MNLHKTQFNFGIQVEYVLTSGSNTVSAHIIDAAAGALTSVTGNLFATGVGPYSVAPSR